MVETQNQQPFIYEQWIREKKGLSQIKLHVLDGSGLKPGSLERVSNQVNSILQSKLTI